MVLQILGVQRRSRSHKLRTLDEKELIFFRQFLMQVLVNQIGMIYRQTMMERVMDWITEPKNRKTVVADIVLIVCGGGILRFSVALSGARISLRVRLLRKGWIL